MEINETFTRLNNEQKRINGEAREAVAAHLRALPERRMAFVACSAYALIEGCDSWLRDSIYGVELRGDTLYFSMDTTVTEEFEYMPSWDSHDMTSEHDDRIQVNWLSVLESVQETIWHETLETGGFIESMVITFDEIETVREELKERFEFLKFHCPHITPCQKPDAGYIFTEKEKAFLIYAAAFIRRIIELDVEGQECDDLKGYDKELKRHLKVLGYDRLPTLEELEESGVRSRIKDYLNSDEDCVTENVTLDGKEYSILHLLLYRGTEREVRVPVASFELEEAIQQKIESGEYHECSEIDEKYKYHLPEEIDSTAVRDMIKSIEDVYEI